MLWSPTPDIFRIPLSIIRVPCLYPHRGPAVQLGWAYRTSSAASGNDATSPGTLTLGAACSVDDRVIFAIAVEANGSDEAISAVSATFCGTFTKDAETIQFVNGGFGCKVSIWSAPVTSAGTPVLTFSWAGSGPATVGYAAAAYSGLDTSVGSGAVDVSNTATDDAVSTTTPTVTSGATSAANELVIGAFGDDGEVATFVEAGGLTRRAFTASASGDVAIMDKDSGATGAQTANCTGASTAGWGAVIVVYKLAGGPPIVLPYYDKGKPRPQSRGGFGIFR